MYKVLITSAIGDVKILVEKCSLPWFQGFKPTLAGKLVDMNFLHTRTLKKWYSGKDVEKQYKK